MLAIIKQFVRRMLMGKGKGILQIPPQSKVDDFAKDLLKKFKDNGIPDEAIKNPKDVRIIWEQITNREAAIFANNLKDVLKKSDPFKKVGEVVDLTGKKIPHGSQSMGGKEVVVDVVGDTVTQMKAMTPMDAMKEANLVIGRKGKYKNLTIDESQDILKKTNDHIFERDIKYDEFGEIIKPDPDDFAGGGIAGMLGEPTYEDDNHRVPYGGGGMGRRLFLKLMGGAAAGTAATKSGLFSLLKSSKPVQVLTSVPIKAGADGMPLWFKPLVNKIIKEGDDVTKKFATVDREIVHKSTLPDSKTDVLVTQDLTTGNVSVDIGLTKHGFADGKFGQPVRLEYKAGEVLEGPIKKGKPTKTKDEFWVEEAEFTGGHPENVKFEESSFNKFGKHESDFSEVEAFSKGKIKKVRLKQIESSQKEAEDLADHFSNYPTPDDFASGGRVPLAGGLAGMLGE